MSDTLTPADDDAVNAAIAELTLGPGQPQAVAPRIDLDADAGDPDAPRDGVPTDPELTSTPKARMSGREDPPDPEPDDDIEDRSDGDGGVDFADETDPDDDLDEDVTDGSPAHGDEVDGEVEPGPPPGSASPTAETDAERAFSMDQAWERLTGAPLTPEEGAGFLHLASSVRNATPEQAQAIQAILSGQLPAGGDGPVPAQPTPTPADATPPAAFEPVPIPEYIDDDTRAVLEAQNERMAQVYEASQAAYLATQQQAAQQYHRDADAQNAAITEQAMRARDQFMADHKLDATDMTVIESQAVATPWFPTYVQKHNGDYFKAAYDTYRHVMSDIPAIQQRVTSTSVATETKKARKDATRKSKASKVSGAASAPPTAGRPTTPQSKKAAFMRDIEEIWGR